MSARGWRVGLLIVALAALGGLPAADAAERVALVIGNGNYAHAPRLNATEHDAKEMAKALTKLGFRVTGPLLDQDKTEMETALGDFGEQARGAAAAVVYFSGHGMEVGGTNYLIPVNAKLQHESRALLEAVPLEVVLTQVGGARNYGLVILDACRDNPLANQMRLADGRTKDWVGKGLKPVEPSGQVYVAYAAKGGTKAQEGRGPNSLFTTALLNYLRNYRQDPLPLSNLFGAVREDVLEATTRTQEPWLYGAFGRKPIYLIDAAPTPTPTPTPTPAPVASASVPSPFRPTVPDEAPPEGSRPQPGQVFRDTLSDGTRGPALVVIGAGEFWMGSPESEAGREPVEDAGRERRHRVRIERAFALGQTEVTVGEFRRFADATRYRTEAERDVGAKGCYAYDAKNDKWDWRAGLNWRKPGYEQTDSHPVVCVSWNDANRYLGWLTKETGRNYRLPTEAEWEYAARAGTTTARYWGDGVDASACGYANVANKEHGWSTAFPCSDGYEFTAPVGSFQPNGWKLNDMLGNVWEWTCSAFAKEYDGSESKCSKKDTTGPLAVRGGAWNDGPAWVRSASRFRDAPADRFNGQGFRLARSL